MTIDDYCKQHGVSRNAYFYWPRKVKEAALTQSGFVELEKQAGKPTETGALPLLIADVGGISLGIREGASMELLSNVIRVLIIVEKIKQGNDHMPAFGLALFFLGGGLVIHHLPLYSHILFFRDAHLVRFVRDEF
jgi:hypothetical protein